MLLLLRSAHCCALPLPLVQVLRRLLPARQFLLQRLEL
jgi:hypothetical protein